MTASRPFNSRPTSMSPISTDSASTARSTWATTALAEPDGPRNSPPRAQASTCGGPKDPSPYPTTAYSRPGVSAVLTNTSRKTLTSCNCSTVPGSTGISESPGCICSSVWEQSMMPGITLPSIPAPLSAISRATPTWLSSRRHIQPISARYSARADRD